MRALSCATKTVVVPLETLVLNEVASYAARKGMSKSAFMRMAHAELSCAVVKGMAFVWNAGMHATARAAGRGF